MERCKKIVLEKDKGGSINIQKKENYATPPILEGYKHVCGEWNNGFTIERCSDGSQLVWVPVGSLDPNGTLDGISYTERFGRRNYRNNDLSERGFYEPLTGELALQFESVKKYGGFYISAYKISINKKTGKPQSVKGAIPLVNINYFDAVEIASTIENKDTVKSHVLFGAEYDSVLEWFIKSKARNYDEIVRDSSNLVKRWNTKNSSRKVVKTGSHKECCINNIYDFAVNVYEITQEQYCGSHRIIRGSDYTKNSYRTSIACRGFINPNYGNESTGFRVALYIE